MLITHKTTTSSSRKTSPKSASKPKADSDFTPGVKPYHGPVDGKSKARKHTALLQAATRALIAPGLKLEVEGKENLPTEGAHVYTFNHPSFLDPPIALSLLKGDLRMVANVKLFKSPVLAKTMEWSGCYPVNRDSPSEVTKSHPIEVLKSGISVAAFAEGGNARESLEGKIGAFKKGPAYSAIHGGAETVVPTAFHYVKAETTGSDWLKAALAGAAGVALGVGGTMVGGTMGTICKVASGVMAGAAIGGAIGKKAMPQKKWYDQTPPLIGKLAGGALGALALGTTAFLLKDSLGVALTGLTGGVGLFGITRSRQARTKVKIKIGEPVPVAPYLNKENSVTELTEDLHRNIGGMMSELSGVPYDDTAPKIHKKGDYAKV